MATPREQLRTLVQGCRVLAQQGHSDLNLGHLSLRDPAGRGLWMKRAGPGLGEVTLDDLLLLDLDGRLLEGEGPLHVEWPIHAEVLRLRADVQAVGHTHAFFTAVLSAAGDAELRPLSHAGALFAAGVPRFTATTNLVRTPEVGRLLAETLGTATAVLMRNHGATFCGASVAHAVVAGVQLERAARAELTLRAAGLQADPPAAEEAAAKRDTIYTDSAVASMFAWCCRQLEPPAVD